MGKAKKAAAETTESTNGEAGTREKVDYVFELHYLDKRVESLGLTMHYPSEAARVKEFLNTHVRPRMDDWLDAEIKVCKKIYE